MSKRLYYKIGEACKAVDIQPYVLRYWETEFPELKPNKSKSGQRVYTEEELEIIRRIKELLYEEGYTIAGAKKRLEGELAQGGSNGASASPVPAPDSGAGTGEAEDPKETQGAAELDSSASQEIQTLRRGLDQALEQARELLALLEPPSS